MSETVRTKVNIHSTKKSMYEEGKRLGLRGKALDLFKLTLCEVEFEIEVDIETGVSTVIAIDGILQRTAGQSQGVENGEITRLIEQVDLRKEHPAIRCAFEWTNLQIALPPEETIHNPHAPYLYPVLRSGFVTGFLLKSYAENEIDFRQVDTISERYYEVEELLKQQ